MSATPAAVLAGVAGQGGTPSLGWLAPLGTALPSDSSTTLNAAFKDMGLVTNEGLGVQTATSSTPIEAYGLSTPVRVLTTGETKTFVITPMETNPVVKAVESRQALSAVTAGAGGAINVTYGPARTVRYAAVFDAVDGTNKIRYVLPQIELTTLGNRAVAKGAETNVQFTFTAYPDSSGLAVYEYNLVAAFAA